MLVLNKKDDHRLIFTDIVEKLKKITNSKRDVEIATLLNADSAKFAQWKKRNTIPIQELVSFAIANNIDMNYLLKDDVEFVDNNSNDSDDSIVKKDDEFIEAYNGLIDKKKQYFYHLVMAESLKEDN